MAVILKTRGAKYAGGFVALGVLLAAGYVAFHWKAISAKRSAGEFAAATTDESRRAAARKLLISGEVARPQVAQMLQTANEEQGFALSVAIQEYIRDLPPSDPQFTVISQWLLEVFPTCGEPGQLAILDQFPRLLASNNPAVRETLKQALANGSPGVAILAIKLAMRPDLNLKSDIVPLLNSASAKVRKEALLAVGPASLGEPVIGDEELFRWLHDPDADVRIVCEAALSTRGLEKEQIDAARKITHPEASERLSLLVDLRFARDSLGEPGPWLERLSKDADPAIRAGAARVACERKLQFAGWVKKLALEDPDPTVRQIANFHRTRSDLQLAGYEGD